jgi:hypothetical protein
MGVSGQRHAPAAVYPRGKNPLYLLYRRLDAEARRKILCPAGDRTPKWTMYHKLVLSKSWLYCHHSDFGSLCWSHFALIHRTCQFRHIPSHAVILLWMNGVWWNVIFNPLKPSGNYMYHLLWQSVILSFANKMYVSVQCHSQNKQRLLPSPAWPVDLCNGYKLCFLWGKDWMFQCY